MPSNKEHSKQQSILRSVSYFSALDANTFELVSRSAIRRTYNSGQHILIAGQQSSGLYVVESGWLKVQIMSSEGREQVLQTIGPGNSFNLINIFADEPNRANVETLEQTVVWMIPREVMLNLLDKNPDLAKLVIQDLAARVNHLIDVVEDLSLRTVESRLARLLLEHAGDQILVRKRWATQALMSTRLGTVPDVLNRALGKLAARGLIQVTRNQIKILDRTGLTDIAKIQ